LLFTGGFDFGLFESLANNAANPDFGFSSTGLILVLF